MQTVDHLLDRMARAVDLAARRRADHQLADKRKREQPSRDGVGQVRRRCVKIAAERQAIITTAFVVVAFSILVQGLTMPWLIKRLNLGRRAESEPVAAPATAD